MSRRRNDPEFRGKEGPTREQDGATMKITFTGKDRCYIGICSRTPTTIITFFGRQVWVCDGDADADGTC